MNSVVVGKANMLLDAPPQHSQSAVYSVRHSGHSSSKAITGPDHKDHHLPYLSSMFDGDVTEIKLSSTRYQLRSAIKLETVWKHRINQWVVRLRIGSGVEISGAGKSASSAMDEFKLVFHATFQQLYSMRPFEMKESEQFQWRALSQLVDIAEYRMNTPVVVREIGRICRARPYPEQIEWIDGRREYFSLAQAPSNMAGLRTFQWFEAHVSRDRLTGKLQHILTSDPMPRPALKGSTRVKNFVQSLAGDQLSTRPYTEMD